MRRDGTHIDKWGIKGVSKMKIKQGNSERGRENVND